MFSELEHKQIGWSNVEQKTAQPHALGIAHTPNRVHHKLPTTAPRLILFSCLARQWAMSNVCARYPIVFARLHVCVCVCVLVSDVCASGRHVTKSATPAIDAGRLFAQTFYQRIATRLFAILFAHTMRQKIHATRSVFFLGGCRVHGTRSQNVQHLHIQNGASAFRTYSANWCNGVGVILTTSNHSHLVDVLARWWCEFMLIVV